MHTLRMVMLAMMVAIGVVISPILRIEGMCPTAHLVNIVCSVLMGPWYSLLCATMIGVIRMMFMGIPLLALTGAVFGAFLSGVFYRLSKGKIICAVIGLAPTARTTLAQSWIEIGLVMQWISGFSSLIRFRSCKILCLICF